MSCAGWTVVSALLWAAHAAAQQPRLEPARVIEDFEQPGRWRAAPASGVELSLRPDAGRAGGRALRIDFDFHGGGGWAALRRDVPIQLPENYELSFWLRADAPRNTLELKLIDASGENVWWINRPEFEFRGDWRRVAYRKRHVTFAWGPARGGELRNVAALELAITAGTGGRGTVWIDDITITPLEPVLPYDATPLVRASAGASAAPRALDGDTTSVWRSATGGAQQLTVDFTRSREYGGVVIDWARPGRARDYDLLISRDGKSWETVREVRGGARDRDYLLLPETESRWLRLQLLAGERTAGYAIREITVMPLAWGESRNRMFETIARQTLPGTLPKYFSSVQSYWTVVGVNGADREGLLNEEGMLEVDQRAFSIEPFLFTGERLITWKDARITQSLERSYLPIPSVQWEADALRLTVTAWADGDSVHSNLWARYRVENRASVSRTPTLYLALRPFQVNPSWQFLNNPGGASTVRTLSRVGQRVIIDSTRTVVSLTPPGGFGATRFDQSELVDWLRRGQLPPAAQVHDDFGSAAGAFAYTLPLKPGEVRDVYIALPASSARIESVSSDSAAARLRAALQTWSSELDGFTLELPGSAARIGNALRSNLAYILINRDRAALQPGSRSYQRSWIRDGSLTSAALLRLGHAAEVRRFAEWYAPFQYPDGKVPCCVDHRGADPVPENDSHGQLIYLITEYFRHTGDRAWLQRMWPHVERAVAYLDSLRQSRRTAEYQASERRAFYGMLPQSISHEGYSEKPMHSYWDDFFALKGFKDAVVVAHALGKDDQARAFERFRDEFRSDLISSFELTMRNHRIDYLPGAVELGDFDATSTTVGVSPVGEESSLPAAALRRTFDRYWDNFVARRDGTQAWDAYTPYELRVVGTFVRLGERRRAHALLDWFLQHQRPAAWNHWAEVVFNDRDTPRFIGDMPHTWVGSDFIRSVLDMFVYERDADQTLVVGAGILPEWLAARNGIAIAGISTHYGRFGFTMQRQNAEVVVKFTGELRDPAGGLILQSPLEQPIRAAVVDGRATAASGDQLRLTRVPREVTLIY